MNRLTYNTIISKEDLLTRYQYKNAYEMPKLDKIIVSLSLKQSRFDRRQLPKLLLASTLITNQKAKTILTKKGDASLGIRKNDPVGTKVTLRRNQALNFLDFINTLVLPRVKNFEGLNKKRSGKKKKFA